MDWPSHKNEESQTGRPLVSIGLIVLAMLIVPVLLYTTTPEGPVKEGDVVFSTGKHRAYFVDSKRYEHLGYEPYCILEPREQLLVVQKLAGRQDGAVLAQPVGRTKIEVPFCPPRAEVILKPHQASLKVDLWGEIRETLARLVAGLW